MVELKVYSRLTAAQIQASYMTWERSGGNKTEMERCSSRLFSV
jgi:hypothetical protein